MKGFLDIDFAIRPCIQEVGCINQVGQYLFSVNTGECHLSRIRPF